MNTKREEDVTLPGNKNEEEAVSAVETQEKRKMTHFLEIGMKTDESNSPRLRSEMSRIPAAKPGRLPQHLAAAC